MRKYIAVFIAGALLMFSGQVLADSVSKVGKKVQAEFVVKVDGETLDEKALSIDGTTSTPNRALADAIGYEVKFINKEVIWTKKEGVKAVELNGATPSEPSEHGYTLESVTSAIEGRERSLNVSRTILKAAETDGVSEEELTRLREGVKKEEDELNSLKAIKEQLQTK